MQQSKTIYRWMDGNRLQLHQTAKNEYVFNGSEPNAFVCIRVYYASHIAYNALLLYKRQSVLMSISYNISMQSGQFFMIFTKTIPIQTERFAGQTLKRSESMTSNVRLDSSLVKQIGII